MKTSKNIGLLFYILFFAGISLTAQSKNKIAFFAPHNFPTYDSKTIEENQLKKIALDYNADLVRDVNSLNNNLDFLRYKLLVLPFGSAFPMDAWQSILNFLNAGGNLVYLGGSPFHQPILWKDSAWITGIPQQTFARHLLIGPADKIEINKHQFYKINQVESLNEFIVKKNDLNNISNVFEGTYRFTLQKDFKDEDGSSGPRNSIIRPLVHLINKDGLPFAAPIIEIDRLQGNGAGARWIFVSCDAEISSGLIRKLIDRALQNSVEFTATPIFASIKEFEAPSIRINLFRPGEKNQNQIEIKLSIKNSSGKIVHNEKVFLSGLSDFKTTTITIKSSSQFKPGFYSIEVEAVDVSWNPKKIISGFWVWDEKLARSSAKITLSKDWFIKDEKVLPIIGTTYMASDVHRKFLYEPNPFIWQKDFAQMKKLGINYVRTGLWNSWTRAMLDRGAIDESFLRSLDAFVMTALQHDVIVCFNFFAFTPPLNGGTNPYLDPRALDWQKTFITLIASRYKEIPSVHFDLINEPSYSPPNDIWKNIPIGDEYEKSEWRNWINKKYEGRISSLQNLWRDSKGDIFSLPSESELSYRIYKEDRRPRKALDFNLFTQDVVTKWADSLTRVIKKVNGALVTLGQDEGGTSNRPAQQFHYTAVDYTSIHSWWYNDDLLWDGLMTKVPEKPNLVSETGLMRLEDIDGEPWRSPETAYQLLDRKFALGFASRCAGVVQWIWNINPYMPIDNESVIGFFRPDGTAKLEIEVLKKYSKFFISSQNFITDFKASEVIVVIPHTKIFSGRKNGDLSTKRIVRLLADHFAITPLLISEYRLNDERLTNTKLIIVPSAEFLNDEATSVLLNASLKGVKVLFTGSLEGNEFGEISPAIKNLGLVNKSLPVSLFEKVIRSYSSSYKTTTITFDNQQSEFIKKSAAESFYQNGNILHEPLPVELAKEKESLAELIKYALEISKIKYHYYEEPLTTSVFHFTNYIMIICVNESSRDITRELKIWTQNEIKNPLAINTTVSAGHSKLILLDRASGKIISESD